MSENARIIFILDGEKKTAFYGQDGAPLKTGAQILDFIQNRSEKEQKEFVRKLELVDAMDRPSSNKVSGAGNWEQILNEKKLFELPYMFHNENQRYADFVYTLNYDTRELGYVTSIYDELIFPFDKLDKTALEKMQNQFEQHIWEDFIEDITPKVIEDVISFEEKAYTKYRREFPVVSRKLKEAGYIFNPENGIWSKRSNDVKKDIEALKDSIYLEGETIDWFDEGA